MGNFSRDPQTRLNDSVAKHYVSVGLQQGVPILDADWNELENLRRYEHEKLGASFVGSGVPAGDDGFRILMSAADNDFAIRKGILLVQGKATVNDSDTTFLTQPNSALANILATPAADVSLVVYIDVWESEVRSVDDHDLVDSRIGVETCIRLKRQWVVLTATGTSAADIPVPAVGHTVQLLAVVNRKAANAKIEFDMIADQRRLHLTLSDVTKAPLEIYGALGNLTFTLDNFAQMLDITESAYFDLLRSDLFMTQNFSTASALETASLSAVFNEVMQTALAASFQAKIRNLNNADGLKTLETLYNVQDHFVKIVTILVTGNSARAATANFLLRLTDLLDGALGVPGLKPAVFTSKDLQAAITAQQAINLEVGNRTQILPHGHISIQLTAAPPATTKIAVGQTFRYTFQITYDRTIPGPVQTESFDVLPAMDPPGWTATLVPPTTSPIQLHTEDNLVLQVDVAVPAITAITTSTLKLQVRSQHNPTEMNSTDSEVAMTIGSGGTQPSPLQIDLTSPAINVDTDTIQIGSGGPLGAPGKGKQLKFTFTYTEAVAAPVDFTITYDLGAGGNFVGIPDGALQLGGSAGSSATVSTSLNATAAAVNGTAGTLRVNIAKKTDATVFSQLVIKLIVQKS